MLKPSRGRVLASLVPHQPLDRFRLAALHPGLGDARSLARCRASCRPWSGHRPRPSAIVRNTRFWSVLEAVKGEPKARCERTNP